MFINLYLLTHTYIFSVHVANRLLLRCGEIYTLSLVPPAVGGKND